MQKQVLNLLASLPHEKMAGQDHQSSNPLGFITFKRTLSLLENSLLENN